MPEIIAPEERLTNLVVALMATEHGLTKAQILESVQGYRQRAADGAKADALEKMFERDKEELRSLGIPVETLGDTADPNDLREARYRIPKAEYDLPSDITFTPAELALLTLAGSVWREGSMSADAQSAVRKIRSLGIDVDEPILGLAPQLDLTDPAFGPLQQGIEQGRVVSFRYLKPGDAAPRVRRMRPLALVDLESRWHVYGIDVDADAERTFLLRRIVGAVTVTRQTFDTALRDGAGERALTGLHAVLERNVALLAVTPGTEAALRLSRRATDAADGLNVPFLDLHIFADELASYGPEVRVIEPVELRVAVIERLRRVLDLHDEPYSGGVSA